MSRFGTTLVAALVLLPLLISEKAQAYDADNTHRWIARRAVAYLVATYPGEYDELLEYTEEVAEGALHEDDLFLDGDDNPATLRVMRHFYFAPTGEGLTYGGETFPSSFEWNAIDNEQNEWDFHDGLRAFQRGELGEAYFIAGHAVHLISDLTVPAHSHLDDHGPPDGDDYENHCSARMESQYSGSLRTPVPGTPIPEFANLAEAYQQTADAAYYRNLYPGNLLGDEPTGVVADMFPDMSKGFFSGKWVIDGIGTEGTDFYVEEPGYYYFSENNAPSLYDIVNYNPREPLMREYGPVSSSAPIVERMADDLVPIAILHSAAVLKLFIDVARTLPETINEELTDKDPPKGCACNGSSSSSGPWFSLLLLIALLRPRTLRVS